MSARREVLDCVLKDEVENDYDDVIDETERPIKKKRRHMYDWKIIFILTENNQNRNREARTALQP